MGPCLNSQGGAQGLSTTEDQAPAGCSKYSERGLDRGLSDTFIPAGAPKAKAPSCCDLPDA